MEKELTPKEIVEELDKYKIGQNQAKKAMDIAREQVEYTL